MDNILEKFTLIEKFVKTQVGEPYLLFPFGKVVKNGNTHEITPEIAANFSLPHFKPPIKLGSHDEQTPAGGHIVELIVKEDGLYALPEWNEKGIEAMKDGAYRYHSPEVFWDGWIENPDNGQPIEAPLIVGDALLHTPHLGEKAKLYQVETQKGDEAMTVQDEFVQVPKSAWESVKDFFSAQTKPLPVLEQMEVDVTESDEYKAAVKERDEYKAELDRMAEEAEAEKLCSEIVAELQDKERFGMMFIELETAEESAAMLGTMNEDQRKWVMQNFSALQAQVDESVLLSEKGSSRQNELSENPADAFNAVVEQIEKEKKISYQDALEIARNEHPDLFKAYQGKGE